MSEIDAYCRWLSRYFFAPGLEPDDLYQEARLAAWLAPKCHARVAARRQVLDVVKIARRKPLLSKEIDVSSPHDTAERVESRELLRAILFHPLPPRERSALDRQLAGVAIGRAARTEHMARYRAKRRLGAILAP